MKYYSMVFLLSVSVLMMFSGCDAFDYHPYDVKIDGEVGINEKNIARIKAVTTGKDTMRIAFMSDTQGWLDEAKAMVQHINARGDVDFVIHGGDLTDFGMVKEFVWQRDVINRLNVPYVAIIGNHDCLGTGEDSFNKIFGKSDYSFIAGRVKFLCLNTNALEFDYSREIPNFAFIEEEVKADSALFDRTVVCMHAGPYSDVFNNNVVKVFQYEIKKYPGLMFCMMGHDHHFRAEDLFDDGIMYYTVDCAKERRYIIFTITPDGYSYELVTY